MNSLEDIECACNPRFTIAAPSTSLIELSRHFLTFSNDLFSELKSKLLVRSHDKEKDVRQQAAIALMNFRPVGEEEDDDEEEVNVNDALIDLMIRDSSS